MSGRCFFDTTILIYSISSGDRRSQIAERLLLGGGCISVQGLNEFVAIARRKLNMSWEDVRSALSEIRVLCDKPVALSVEIHEAALEIGARYSYQIYDSLMLAAALQEGCETFYSEDMQDGQKIGSLTIRNPFLLC